MPFSSWADVTLSLIHIFIIALCHLIQNLTIDNLHIIGDIYDRGPRADIIMNELMCFHDVDIQLSLIHILVFQAGRRVGKWESGYKDKLAQG